MPFAPWRMGGTRGAVVALPLPESKRLSKRLVALHFSCYFRDLIPGPVPG
jgi:hypothetical protein